MTSKTISKALIVNRRNLQGLFDDCWLFDRRFQRFLSRFGNYFFVFALWIDRSLVSFPWLDLGCGLNWKRCLSSIVFQRIMAFIKFIKFNLWLELPPRGKFRTSKGEMARKQARNKLALEDDMISSHLGPSARGTIANLPLTTLTSKSQVFLTRKGWEPLI